MLSPSNPFGFGTKRTRPHRGTQIFGVVGIKVVLVDHVHAIPSLLVVQHEVEMLLLSLLPPLPQHAKFSQVARAATRQWPHSVFSP